MKINLKKIRKKKLKAVEKIEKQFKPEIYRAAALSAGTEFRSVEVNIEQSEGFPVLVEISGVMPSLNVLENIQPTRIARDLESSGLQTAVVVGIDDLVLKGHPGWINLVKYHTQLPVIARDFLFHPIQIYQARATGADAVIIDLRWVDDELAAELVNATFEMGLEPIVQVQEPRLPATLDREVFSTVIMTLSEELPVEAIDQRLKEIQAQHGGKVHIILEVPAGNTALIEKSARTQGSGILLTSDLLAADNYRQRFEDILALLEDKRASTEQ